MSPNFDKNATLFKKSKRLFKYFILSLDLKENIPLWCGIKKKEHNSFFYFCMCTALV